MLSIQNNDSSTRGGASDGESPLGGAEEVAFNVNTFYTRFDSTVVRP